MKKMEEQTDSETKSLWFICFFQESTSTDHLALFPWAFSYCVQRRWHTIKPRMNSQPKKKENNSHCSHNLVDIQPDQVL